jgi:hypothetical protein
VEQELSSVVGIVQTVTGDGGQDADGQADTAHSTGKMNPQSPGWPEMDHDRWHQLVIPSYSHCVKSI